VDDNKEVQVFYLRIVRDLSGRGNNYVAVWDAASVRNNLVHHLLDLVQQHVRGLVNGMVGGTTLSEYGELTFGDSEEEDLQF